MAYVFPVPGIFFFTQVLNAPDGGVWHIERVFQINSAQYTVTSTVHGNIHGTRSHPSAKMNLSTPKCGNCLRSHPIYPHTRLIIGVNVSYTFNSISVDIQE